MTFKGVYQRDIDINLINMYNQSSFLEKHSSLNLQKQTIF